MSNYPKYFDLPTGYKPMNRRVYAAAKKPFAWLWAFVSWVGAPFLVAFPIAAIAAFLLTVLQYTQTASTQDLGQIAFNIFAVSLVWTVYLGAVFLFIRVVQSIFGR